MDSEALKIGVVGFSQNRFDKRAAYEILYKVFHRLVEKHNGREIEIVSGYTNSGVPKIAYQLADRFGLTTVGFTAKQALTVENGLYPVQKVILRGARFGDESQDFVNYIDGLVRVGGGPQSRHEVDLFKERIANNPAQSILIEHEVTSYER